MSGLRNISPAVRADTSLRGQLVAAFDNNDHLAIRRLGWWRPWQTAHSGWEPKQSCTARDFIPYARWLGNEDPDAVADAFIALAGQWRPTPAEIRAHLKRKTAKDPQANVGLSRDKAATPTALRATAAAVAAGEHVCGCGAPTMSKWKPDAAGVLRCHRRFRPHGTELYDRGCGGLEQGQAYAAEDAGYTAPPTVGLIESTSSATGVE